MRAVVLLVSSLAITATAFAQTAKIPYQIQAVAPFTSGSHDNPTSQAVEVFQKFIAVPGAPWLRALVSSANLPGTSYLEFAAVQDGHTQRLDANELANWGMGSAYFNGDTLLMKLVAGPYTQGVQVTVNSMTVGLMNQGTSPSDICGNNDDRQLSTDARVGRIMPQGCTGWLISSTNCFLTAGHCCNDTSTNFNVVQFNVPASLADGTTQNPPPQDQYPIDYNSRMFQDQGIGCDWCAFTTDVNGQTNKHAGQVQGAFFSFGPIPNNGTTVRVTGYGTATGVRNQVQQTHTGGLQQNGASLCYAVDTTGGNSGSPVINDSTGLAIGIHTHGGCTTTGGCNSGTPITHAQLQAAIASVCGSGDSADLVVFGQSCGTKTRWSALDGNGVPKLGTSFALRISGPINAVPAVLVFGGSNAYWGAQWLPLDLAPVAGGFTCKLFCSVDFAMPMQLDAQGNASLTLSVPNNPWLQGQRFFVQAAVYEQGINAIDLVTTNALRGTMASQ